MNPTNLHLGRLSLENVKVSQDDATKANHGIRRTV